MTRVSFAKYHGLGNDFIIVDAREDGDLLDPQHAQCLCDRHRGVGADGVLTLLPPRIDTADLRLHIYNSDGSVAEMCGNGLRCVVGFVGGAMRIDTDAGVLTGVCLDDGRVRVTLGQATIGDVVEVQVGETHFEGLNISMGNPHWVLNPYLPDTDLLALARRFGPALESDSAFPQRTNVEFIKVRDDGLDVVVFERGAGITQACGTGAAASAVAAAHWGAIEPSRTVQVNLPGGALDVAVDGDGVTITGDAVHVFDGTWSG